MVEEEENAIGMHAVILHFFFNLEKSATPQSTDEISQKMKKVLHVIKELI